MKGKGIKLPFRLLRIPVILDYSFLLILPLFAYLIGSQLPAYAELIGTLGVEVDLSGLLEGATPWLLGLAGAVGLFASVLVHELGHAVVARLYGVNVREIRLWFLGGVAQLDEMPRGRGAEAVVAIVGPITSLGIGALLWWAVPVSGGGGFTLILSYLALTNVMLALFNLLPALPLDGGRVLRGVLSLFMTHLRATNVAAAVSALMAILLGLFGFFTSNFLLVIMAFFIYNAGRAEAQAAVLEDVYGGQTVTDLMTSDPVTVDPAMPLNQFIRMAQFLPHLGYPVVDDSGALVGYARIADARARGVKADSSGSPTPLKEASEIAAALRSGGRAPVEESFDATFLEGLTVMDVTLPAETIDVQVDALTALRQLAQGKLGRLMVLDSAGRLVGVLGKSDLMLPLKEAQTA